MISQGTLSRDMFCFFSFFFFLLLLFVFFWGGVYNSVRTTLYPMYINVNWESLGPFADFLYIVVFACFSYSFYMIDISYKIKFRSSKYMVAII